MHLGQLIRDNRVIDSSSSFLSEQESLLSESIITAFDHTSIGILYIGFGGDIKCFNQRILKILNINAKEFKAPTPKDILKYSESSFKNSKDLENLFTISIKDYFKPLELILETYENKVLFCNSQPVIKDGLIEGVVWSVTDITEHKTQERIATHRSLHDALTQLPNRTYLFQKLDELTCSKNAANKKFAVLFLDLDDFKRVNDEYGHSVGDQVLINFTTKIRASLRVPDILARLSGDEFIAILEDVESKEAVELVIERIYDNLSGNLEIPGIDIRAFVSIGVSFYPDNSFHCRELIRQADKAMYQAKRKGKNTFCFYDQSMES